MLKENLETQDFLLYRNLNRNCEMADKQNIVSETKEKEDVDKKENEAKPELKIEKKEDNSVENSIESSDPKNINEDKENNSAENSLESSSDPKNIIEEKENNSAKNSIESSSDPKNINEEKESKLKSKETSNLSVLESDKEKEEVVDSEKELEVLFQEGMDCLYAKKDPAEAAELLGLACEKARELYGEMGDECADLFYHYGCAMLECSKVLENTVFGEKGPKDEKSSSGEEEEAEDEEDEAPIMLTKKTSMAVRKMEAEKANSAQEKNEEDTTEDNEDEDNMLRAAWEMFELSKIIFQKQKQEDKVADIYMKLGEVSIESGNLTAVDDMKTALEIRKRISPEGDRIIPETHFHIGLAYALFEKFDEAIEQFSISKNLLTERVSLLEKSDTEVALNEIKEIKELLPEIDEKILDMTGSKEEKLKAEQVKATNGESSGSSPNKETSNISHLVKRKRKLEDIGITDSNPSSAPKKQVCLDKNESTDEKKEDALLLPE